VKRNLGALAGVQWLATNQMMQSPYGWVLDELQVPGLVQLDHHVRVQIFHFSRDFSGIALHDYHPPRRLVMRIYVVQDIDIGREHGVKAVTERFARSPQSVCRT
jgi:hypothetical protein